MQREIKFRAIKHQTKEIIYFTLEDLMRGKYVFSYPEHWVFSQFTGLLDKNGKEIYEGDIVNEFRESRSFPEGRIIQRVIKWQDDMTLDDSFGETAVGFNLFGGALEIIGNRFENPDLLKQ